MSDPIFACDPVNGAATPIFSGPNALDAAGDDDSGFGPQPTPHAVTATRQPNNKFRFIMPASVAVHRKINQARSRTVMGKPTTI
jgi:hypothetical protein